MLLREFYQPKQQLDEAAFVAPLLYPIFQQMLMMGGTTLAAWLASKALQEADIRFPNIQSDFEQDVQRNLDIPSGVTIPREDFDLPADEIQKYLNGIAASTAAADAAIDKKMGGDNKPPRNRGKTLRRAGDIIEDIIEWLISVLGLKLFKLLVGIGLGLIAIYTIYKMSKWIASWFKSDEAQDEIEKAKSESLDERQIWARSGKKVVRKYRCSGGQRSGRIVSKLAQCFAAPNPKKKASMKRTQARFGKRMARKAKRTKRTNPASRRVQALNRGGSRR